MEHNARSEINVSPLERWASALGGAGLVLFALLRRSPLGIPMALAGGWLIYRGATGRCPVYKGLGMNTAPHQPVLGAGDVAARALHVEKSVTVNRSAEDLYRFWRDLENLPRFMDHLESVTAIDRKCSHWVAKAPLGTMAEWDAEIAEERENELISWRSLEHADVQNRGTVRFVPAPGGRGTEVHVSLDYSAPGGAIGATIARLLGENPEQQVSDDLRHFKQLMEAGEIPTTEGQPTDRE